MRNAATDVANAIAGAGLGLVYNVTVFDVVQQQVQDSMPSRAVFCHLNGSYASPLRPLIGNFAEAGVGAQEREPRVVLHVRSAPHDYGGGETLARSVKDALHDVPMTGYDAVRVVEGDPMFLYQTNNAEYVFGLNCHLWIYE